MSPSVPPSSSKEPRAKDPDTFNGRKPDELNKFVMQCYLVFKLQPFRFLSEDVKVSYMISYLRGIAMDAVRPIASMSTMPDELLTVDAFVEYLRANFGDPDERGTARRKLKALRQTGTASEYFSRFWELIAVLAEKARGLQLEDEVALHDELVQLVWLPTIESIWVVSFRLLGREWRNRRGHACPSLLSRHGSLSLRHHLHQIKHLLLHECHRIHKVE